MTRELESRKDLVNEKVTRHDGNRETIPTPCGRGSSCASEASYKCRGGVHTSHLSWHLTPHPVATLLPSPARGEGACHSNSGTPQSLLNVKHLTSCASELRARFDDENDAVIADVNRRPVKRERVRNRLNVLTTLRKTAFTLAEVLVTLAVIGIVAAMTIPTVMNKYQQKVAETRAMQFYSVMNNAIELSEIDNGYKTTWDFRNEVCTGNGYEEECLIHNFEKFYKPYLKISNYKYFTGAIPDDRSFGGLVVYFNNGSSVIIGYHGKDFFFYPIGSNALNDKHQIENKDYFKFGFYPTKSYAPKDKYLMGKGMEPYILYTWDGNEETLPCLMKTKLNGWKFPDDCNPFK